MDFCMGLHFLKKTKRPGTSNRGSTNKSCAGSWAGTYLHLYIYTLELERNRSRMSSCLCLEEVCVWCVCKHSQPHCKTVDVSRTDVLQSCHRNEEKEGKPGK